MNTRSALVLLALMVVGEARAAQPTVLIYPSGPTVPANLLRIELQCSTPLHPPIEVQNLKLTNGAGRAIDNAFLDLLLPSADRERVTVLLHPGRVKSGVGLNRLYGRALSVGDDVLLTVDHPALEQPVHKRWHVTAPTTALPDPSHWSISLPIIGSRSPLIVRLGDALGSTAATMIAIRGPEGDRVAGAAQLEAGETTWCFTPDEPWHAGHYALVTHPDLEDVAGNRPGAPFEVRSGGTAQVRNPGPSFDLVQ